MSENKVVKALEALKREVVQWCNDQDLMPDDSAEAIRFADEAVPIAKAQEAVIEAADKLYERVIARPECAPSMQRFNQDNIDAMSGYVTAKKHLDEVQGK